MDLVSSDGEKIKADRNSRNWVFQAVMLEVTTAAVLGDNMLWYRQLGHPNEPVLKNRIKDSRCVRLPERLTKTIPCEDCAITKLTKLSTIGPSLMSYDCQISLVVADPMGPSPEKAMGDHEFVLEIRDVYSTYNRTYLLKNKYETTGIIKSYIPEAESHTGKKFIHWRTNGSGEFINKMLAIYFFEKGIHVQKSLPYLQEQNESMERTTQTA